MRLPLLGSKDCTRLLNEGFFRNTTVPDWKAHPSHLCAGTSGHSFVPLTKYIPSGNHEVKVHNLTSTMNLDSGSTVLRFFKCSRYPILCEKQPESRIFRRCLPKYVTYIWDSSFLYFLTNLSIPWVNSQIFKISRVFISLMVDYGEISRPRG